MKKRILICLFVALVVALSSTFLVNAADNRLYLSTNVAGDINGDNRLLKSDFDLLERYLVGYDMSKAKSFDLSKCDYNSDGNIDIKDLKGIAEDAGDMGTYSPPY